MKGRTLCKLNPQSNAAAGTSFHGSVEAHAAACFWTATREAVKTLHRGEESPQMLLRQGGGHNRVGMVPSMGDLRWMLFSLEKTDAPHLSPSICTS